MRQSVTRDHGHGRERLGSAPRARLRPDYYPKREQVPVPLLGLGRYASMSSSRKTWCRTAYRVVRIRVRVHGPVPRTIFFLHGSESPEGPAWFFLPWVGRPQGADTVFFCMGRRARRVRHGFFLHGSEGPKGLTRFFFAMGRRAWRVRHGFFLHGSESPKGQTRIFFTMGRRAQRVRHGFFFAWVGRPQRADTDFFCMGRKAPRG